MRCVIPSSLVCCAGVFRLFANVASSSRFATLLVYKKWKRGGEGVGKERRKVLFLPLPLLRYSSLPLSWMLFRICPSLFRVRIQHGARLIKMRSLAKIRLHCRLPPSLFSNCPGVRCLQSARYVIYFLMLSRNFGLAS